MFEGLTESMTRSRCKEALEALEFWLRRIIHQTLSSAYGADYISHQLPNGDFLIKKKMSESLLHNHKEEPSRYPKPIDAALLEDAINIVCNPNLYEKHFREVFSEMYPEGVAELRTYLTRLISPRNSLSHANPIGRRDAEQVLCYSNDAIDAIKLYYSKKGMQATFNVPTIISLTDSFGNKVLRESFNFLHDLSFKGEPKHYLRPGDTLSLEVEMDPSFSEREYTIKWSVIAAPETSNSKRFDLKITNKHVGEQLSIECRVISKKDWHVHTFYDDRLGIYYLVLPLE